MAISMVDGYAFIDHLSWDAFNESGDLIQAVEDYKERYGYYPEAVLADQTDLGMLSYAAQSRELKVIPWREERMILVVYPSHRLAGREWVEPAELEGERFVSFDEDLEIRKALDRFLRDCGVAVDPVLQFDNIQMIKEAVAIGSGISILP